MDQIEVQAKSKKINLTNYDDKDSLNKEMNRSSGKK
jgi:hypothetical protein